jgi:iron complex transport system permease protein
MPNQLISPSLLAPILLAASLGLVIIALSYGALEIPLAELSQALLQQTNGNSESDIYRYVIWDIRLPRLFTAILVGLGLALSGVCMQALFRNPLADPALIGVSNGAAVGAVTVIVFAPIISSIIPIVFALPLAAFIAGLIATLIVVAISTRNGRSDTALLLLAGIAINAVAGAMIGLMTFIADDNQLRDLTFWSMGSVGKASWRELAVAAPLIIVCSLALFHYRHVLNSLLMGEQVAGHMGHNIKKIKLHIIILTTIIVATTVSIAGVIFFVGLVIPHLLRIAIGPDHRVLLPFSMLSGAVIMMLADSIARTIIAPAEMPIGLIMSAVGGPFFILLLLQQRKNIM